MKNQKSGIIKKPRDTHRPPGLQLDFKNQDQREGGGDE
jgi:hypothetical protein